LDRVSGLGLGSSGRRRGCRVDIGNAIVNSCGCGK